MFIVNHEQYALVERALDRDDRYVRDDDDAEHTYIFREGVGGRIVAMKMRSSTSDPVRMPSGLHYYAAGRVMPLAIDLMLEEEGGTDQYEID